MNETFNYKKNLDSFLENYKGESRLKFPSYYFLELYSDKLLELIEIWRRSNLGDDRTILLKRDVQVFKSDLIGSLKHDFEKRLVRYYQKWTMEKSIIDSLKLKFLRIAEPNEF